MIDRMTIKLQMNREVMSGDYISAGSYTIKCQDGTNKQFDFAKEAIKQADDNNILEIEVWDFDDDYSDPVDIHDIMNMIGFDEIFIGIDTDSLKIESIKSIRFYEGSKEYELLGEMMKSANDHIYVDYNI